MIIYQDAFSEAVISKFEIFDFIDASTFDAGAYINIGFYIAMTTLCFYMGRRLPEEESATEEQVDWRPLQTLVISMIGVYPLATSIPKFTEALAIALRLVRGLPQTNTTAWNI